MLNIIGWFEIVVGIAIIGLWVTLLATRQVPQVPAGNRDIWFHLTAELLTAALLVGAGIWLLTTHAARAGVLSSLALGALLYTTVNSPGYYADRDDWPTVMMFVVLAATTATAAVVLLSGIV